jgi:hypothetical protein
MGFTMSEQTWIEFQGRRSTAEVAQPRVTITRLGTIGINMAAYRLLGEPGRISYVTDGSKKRFGIKPADENTPNSYPVRPQESGRSFSISAKAFLKWSGFQYGDQVYVYTMRLENGIGVVEISEASKPVSKKQKTG